MNNVQQASQETEKLPAAEPETQQPAEVLRELLGETRRLVRVTEKSNSEQKAVAERQLKKLRRIDTVLEIWFVLMLLGFLGACLVGLAGGSILGGF